MSKSKKTYFLPPTLDFICPPPDGSLFLGSIICSVSKPELSLNKSNIVSMADLSTTAVETNCLYTITDDRKPRSRRRETFLQFAKRGSGVYIKRSSRQKYIFECGTVTTVFFEPTPQYVAEAVKTPAVKAWLKEPKQRLAPTVSLYLVTGMKLAKNAKVKYSIFTNTTIKTRIHTSTGLSLPESIYGAKGSFTRDYEDEIKFRREAEFIFAFQVKKLRFRHGQDVKIEEYTKGACLESAEGEGGSEIESVLVDDAEGSNVGIVSDGADVGSGSDDDDVENDIDDDNVENVADDSGTGNNAPGTGAQNDADSPRITAAKLVSNVAKNRKLVFKIVENLLGQVTR